MLQTSIAPSPVIIITKKASVNMANGARISTLSMTIETLRMTGGQIRDFYMKMLD